MRKDYSWHKKYYSDLAFWKNTKWIARSELLPALLLYYTKENPNIPTHINSIIEGVLGYLICPVSLTMGNEFGEDPYDLVNRTLSSCGQYITLDVRNKAFAKYEELLLARGQEIPKRKKS